MPETGAWIAERLGVDGFLPEALYDPGTNLRFGTWYLGYVLERFGDVDAALWAYNAGPTRAESWIAGDEPPYPGTAAYVARVRRFLPAYRAALALPWLYVIAPPLPL
jgi:soluble lytic murein transglycosylase